MTNLAVGGMDMVPGDRDAAKMRITLVGLSIGLTWIRVSDRGCHDWCRHPASIGK